MYCITVYTPCYTDLFMVLGLGLEVYYLWEVCARFQGCGAFIYGVVLVTVMTINWLGACVHLNLLLKCRFLWAFYYGYVGYLC